MPARYSAAMIDRRHFIALAAIPLAGLGAHTSQATGMSRVTAYAFMFKGLDGDDILLSSYAGHPLLVVNTASQCGYTPQYAGLQQIWTRYRHRGLIVLGVPRTTSAGRSPAAKARSTRPRRGRTTSHSNNRKGRGEGQGRPSVLQMGGGRPPPRSAALEFSQVPHRARWPTQGCFRLGGRTDRSAVITAIERELAGA